MGNQENLRQGWAWALPLPSCSTSGRTPRLPFPGLSYAISKRWVAAVHYRLAGGIRDKVVKVSRTDFFPYSEKF